METGQKIKNARVKAGMTQQELGKAIGVQKSAIAKYENGRVVNIKRDTLLKIAHALNISPSELVTCEHPAQKATQADTANVAPAFHGEAVQTPRLEPAPEKTHPTLQKNPSPERHAMRTFSKSSKLNNVLYDVRGPVVDEAARMEAAGANILKLNIGNPAPFGFRTPDEVVYDMGRQLTSCEGYSDSKGLYSARKAIMQ